MVRLARAVAAAALVILALAGCEHADECPDLSDFAILEPAGAAELVPGTEGVRVAWTPVDTHMELVLFDGPRTRGAGFPDSLDGAVQVTESTEFVFNGNERPGVYRIRAMFSCGDVLPGPTAEGSPLQLIYAQGAEIAGGALVFDGSQAERDIVVRTVSLSTFELELLLDVAHPLDAGARIIARTSVPGELVAMNRTLGFTGQDVDGLPIPAGTYNVWARVHARDGTITYDRLGPTLTWTP